MSNGWCTIESDPAVFTEMMERFGAKGVAVEEVLSVDEASLNALTQPVLGLVLLFKWKPTKEERNVIPDAEVYFARQKVNNACATQAIINILLNNADKVELGEELSRFLDFTAALDADTRGEMVGQSDVLRAAHNSFARSSAFSFEDKTADEDDDVYHFIAYVHKNDIVWELDGLQDGPIFIEPAEQASWLSSASSAIQARMEEISKADTKGAGRGISFSLMAVTADRVTQLQSQIAVASDAAIKASLEAELQQLQEQRERGRAENVRRRHNYIPLVVNLLRALKDKGVLRQAIDNNKLTREQAAQRKKNRAE